jgi:hypothetical protein
MNTFLPSSRRLSTAVALVVLSAFTLTPCTLAVGVKDKNPTGKLYVVGAEGDSQVASGGKVSPLAPKAIFQAQGSQIETKVKGNLTMVLSNGTGLFLDQDSQLDVKRFTQEPFTASRTDLELEPSVSHTEAFIPHGTLAVSTSKLAAGSTLTFLTPLGSINLLDGDLVIEADATGVKFSLLKGEATFNGGPLDLGGRVLHAGEQVVIQPGAPGQPNLVQISKIPAAELPALEALAARAYAARKTVFFETDDSGDINAVPVVNAALPVQAAISPSRLPN